MVHLLGIILILVFLFVSIFYIFARKSFSHWKWKKVPYLEPESLIFGHYYDVIMGNITPGEYFRLAYEKFSTGKWGGLYIFWKPILLIRDPNIVKDVLRNIDHFDRNSYMVNPKRPLTKHLFNLSGAEWKAMRNALLPAFSPGKMKVALELVKEGSAEFLNVLSDEMKKNSFVDIVDISERYCIDVMTSFIFGLQSNTLRDPKSVFRQLANKQNKPNIFTAVVKEVCPKLINVLNISSIDTEIEEFFYSLVRKTTDMREKTVHAFDRDFINVMLKLRDRVSQNMAGIDRNHEDLIFHHIFKDLNVKLISAQCFIMFMAGFKPTSFLMNCLWLEVAKNKGVQEKMQKEIDLVLLKYDNEISCESLYEMTYLDQVIAEIIRLHPVSPLLFRTCNKDYLVPNTDFVIEKGTEIIVSIYGIHHDGTYYTTPEEFNPEHFSKDSQASRPSGAFISFGEGPRQCIAMRLASVIVKLAIVKVLGQYTISLSPKMTSTLKFSKYLKVMRFNNPILLHCTPRDVEKNENQMEISATISKSFQKKKKP